jgi:hypothetical protein
MTPSTKRLRSESARTGLNTKRGAPAARLSFDPASYLIELAVAEKTLLAFEPMSRIVPTTITRMTKSITAYSAMSCPLSSHAMRCIKSRPSRNFSITETMRKTVRVGAARETRGLNLDDVAGAHPIAPTSVQCTIYLRELVKLCTVVTFQSDENETQGNHSLA